MLDEIGQRGVDGVLQGAAAGFDRDDGGAQHFHAVYIERLAAAVLFAHVNDAFHAEQGADRGRGNAVLARARLGDDAFFAQPARQKRLPNRVVDFVCAGVIQILAL